VCGLPTAKNIQLSAEASVKSSLAKDKTFLFLRKKGNKNTTIAN
jgi:hypothetical protein